MNKKFFTATILLSILMGSYGASAQRRNRRTNKPASLSLKQALTAILAATTAITAPEETCPTATSEPHTPADFCATFPTPPSPKPGETTVEREYKINVFELSLDVRNECCLSHDDELAPCILATSSMLTTLLAQQPRPTSIWSQLNETERHELIQKLLQLKKEKLMRAARRAEKASRTLR